MMWCLPQVFGMAQPDDNPELSPWPLSPANVPAARPGSNARTALRWLRPEMFLALLPVAACYHRAPAAITPFVTRWGPDASSDTLRRSARCSACGARGATTMLPSWGGSLIGWRPLPSGA